MILRSRSISLCLAVSLIAGPLTAYAQPAPAPVAPAAGSATAATASIAAGDKATRAKDYATALTQYQSAQGAVPSARAEMGVADALYNLGRLGEAYDTYNDVQTTYGAKLGAVEKGLVTKRLKELATKTGYLSIRVNQDGAEVDVDTKVFGTTPVPALVRVATGTHAVHISKAGFVPFDGNAEVAADGKAVVDATLAPVATQGHLVVHASGPDPLRVLVDGVDVGATPWEGDVPPGTHSITGRSSSATAAGQTVDVAVGSRTAIDLVASDTAAHVSVTTSDGKGVIYLDGVVKGEGTFKGDVAPGPHSVVVSRDGYQRFEKTLTLAEQQTWAETVTLSQTPSATVGQGEADHPYKGLYGGFGLTALFGVGGMGTETRDQLLHPRRVVVRHAQRHRRRRLRLHRVHVGPRGVRVHARRHGRRGEAERDVRGVARRHHQHHLARCEPGAHRGVLVFADRRHGRHPRARGVPVAPAPRDAVGRSWRVLPPHANGARRDRDADRQDARQVRARSRRLRVARHQRRRLAAVPPVAHRCHRRRRDVLGRQRQHRGQ